MIKRYPKQVAKKSPKDLNRVVILKLQQKMMNKKNLFQLFSVFTLLVFSVGLVSALTLSSPSNDLSVAKNEATLSLSNNDAVNQDVKITISNIVNGGNQVLLSVDPLTVDNLAPGASSSVKVKMNDVIGNFQFGKHTTTIKAVGEDSSSGAPVANATSIVTFRKSFCVNGEVGGNLIITDVSIDNTGEGDDDEWKLLDTVEVEVEVENIGTIDVDDVIIEIAMFDSQGRDQSNDLDFDNADEEKIEIGDLNDGDEEKVTFSFKIPADFDDGDYKLAIKVYGDKAGERAECADTSQDLDNNFYELIDVQREDDEGKFIAFDNIRITPDQVTCGDSVTLVTDIFNIGDEDQDQVKVNLRSSELDLDQSFEIRNDLDEGDKEQVSFSFIVPDGLKDQLYLLDLSAEYDFRRDSYRESSDTPTRVGLRVLGCQQAPPTSPPPTSGRIAAISASLASDAKAGQELIVTSTITNLLDNTASFVVDASGFESWAELNSISNRLVTLNSGESADVNMRFNVKKETTGEQSFLVQVRSGDKLETREVAVNIASSATPSGGLGGLNFGDNTLIWVIGIINVILIILIIIVAVRISQR